MADKEGVESTSTSAREKIQDMWTSTLKSMSNVWEDNEATGEKIARMKKAMGNDLENAFKSLFASVTSCTNGGDASESLQSPESVSHRASVRAQPSSPLREKEEFFYSQFLQDERHRAAQAVTSLQKAKASKDVQSPTSPKRTGPTHGVPGLFPVSSPSRGGSQIVIPAGMGDAAPLRKSPVKVPLIPDASFDDGISAISAITLDEMARQAELANSQRLGTVQSDLTSDAFELIGNRSNDDSTLFPPTNCTDDCDRERLASPQKSPFGLTKQNRSFGTYGSNRSKGSRSMHTKSTQSTHTTHFSTVWRKDEQKYWQDVVHEEKSVSNTANSVNNRVRSQSRADSVSLKGLIATICQKRETRANLLFLATQDFQKMYRNDGTFTTATSSSVYSSLSSRQHPHETFPMHASDFVNKRVPYNGPYDPDRIEHVLILEHDTEIGEI
jgi:hypothetical protein